MRRTILLVVLSVGIASGSTRAWGQMATSRAGRAVPVRSDSRLWLVGSSNIRGWTCRATILDARISMIGGATGEPNDLPYVSGAFVSVPVRSLKCGDRHMEAHLYDALKAPKGAQSFIVAHLDGLPCNEPTARTIDVTGRLNIAGVERPITIPVRGERLADGTLHARGTLPILMTDFGISPPRPWGGILRTADKVLIQFDIFVDPRQPQRASAEPVTGQ